MWSWIAIGCSGLLHISAAYRGPRWQFYLFKPLTIIFLLVLGFQGADASWYSNLILAGLALSLVGDIFLMLPTDRFVHGLIAFLAAHVLYSIAFWFNFDGSMVWWLPAMLFGAGILVFLLLLPNLGKMMLPVAVYIAVIAQMAWAAGEFWLATGSTAALLAFVGALFFMVSDTVLAFEKFKGTFVSATAIVMTTYFIAQSLIIASVL